jgi:hypothetical protein
MALGNPVRVARLVRCAGIGGGLFGQHANILAHSGDLLVQLSQSCPVGHDTSCVQATHSTSVPPYHGVATCPPKADLGQL